MGEESIVPRAVVVLGKALRPVAGKVAARIDKAPARRERPDNVGEFLSRHLRQMDDDVEALSEDVNRELGGAVAGAGDDADVWRAVARLEVRIEGLLDSYDEVRGAEGDPEDAPGLSLLADIYRNLLRQILTWLNEILEFVDRPLAALRSRGLPTEGKVDLAITLTLESPSPQLESLARWAGQRADELDLLWDEEAERDRPRSDFGLLALVLSAFGLGWLFGGDDE